MKHVSKIKHSSPDSIQKRFDEVIYWIVVKRNVRCVSSNQLNHEFNKNRLVLQVLLSRAFTSTQLISTSTQLILATIQLSATPSMF